jgi:hypothetical protein
METLSETKTFSTLDLYLSAFLVLHEVTPKLENSNGKVVFSFPVKQMGKKAAVLQPEGNPCQPACYHLRGLSSPGL